MSHGAKARPIVRRRRVVATLTARVIVRRGEKGAHFLRAGASADRTLVLEVLEDLAAPAGVPECGPVVKALNAAPVVREWRCPECRECQECPEWGRADRER